jgi:hypothetical protein
MAQKLGKDLIKKAAEQPDLARQKPLSDKRVLSPEKQKQFNTRLLEAMEKGRYGEIERLIKAGAALPSSHFVFMSSSVGTARKRSPTKIIESTSNPEIEHTFAKFRGKELKDYTVDSSTETQSFRVPIDSKEQHMGIHTHPSSIPKRKRSVLDTLFPGLFHPESRYEERREIGYSALPSSRDMELFLEEKNEKAMAIAVREPETGKVRGYTIIMKTDKTPKPDLLGLKFARDTEEYRQGYRRNLSAIYEHFEKFAGKYHLKYRFLPAKGYQLNEAKTQFVKKKD